LCQLTDSFRNVKRVVDDEDEMEIPADLIAAPSGPNPEVPIETMEPRLPVGGLTPLQFEQLCLRLVRQEGHPQRCRRYGKSGQRQYGIDIYSRLPNARYATYQCKRYATFTSDDVKAAVEEFMKGSWRARSDRFVLCTSADSADDTTVQEEVERQTDKLAALITPIVFDFWDAEALSDKLRDEKDIVRQFFGPHWLRRFLGINEPAVSDSPGLAEMIQEAVRDGQAPLIVSLEWAPALLRPRLEDLARENPTAFRQLSEHLGSPPEPVLLRAVTQTPPPWLPADDDEMWDLLGRIAQAVGEWATAARALERVAALRSGTAAARAFVRAAVSVEAAENGHPDRDRLLDAAWAADPRNPSLILARLDDDTPPAEQLTLLQDLHSDDAEERALIAAQRSIAQLLSLDLDAAHDSLDEIRAALPGSLLIDGLDVSITVQAGRLAVIGHRSLDRSALRNAGELATGNRHRLLEQARFSEATRMLMLRGDAHALLGERNRAAKILRTALPEERERQEQKEVLAMAAERAMDARLVLEMLDGSEITPTTQRLRLAALAEVGTPRERAEALRGLDDLVAEDGPRSAEAACLRLGEALGTTQQAPWSEHAAIYLRSHGHERVAVTAEALYSVPKQGWPPVEELLRPYGQTPWAVAARLRVALHPEVAPSVAVEMAHAALDLGLGQALQIDAGRALSRGGRFREARRVVVRVAHDPNCPEPLRADAFDLLMRIVGHDLGDWRAAGELHDEWTRLAPGDTRAQAWAPRIANRRTGL
jgi:hypothetical protein